MTEKDCQGNAHMQTPNSVLLDPYTQCCSNNDMDRMRREDERVRMKI